jgi:starch-binding outer membrane protein, SusD/RagB family
MTMKFAKSLALAAGVSLLAASCADDLNLKPKYGLTAEQVYADPNNYINVLAKIYAGLSISGNNGPAGMPDIGGIDEGFSQYVRVMWNLQQLPTDESICGWADPGIPELNTMDWNDNSPFVSAMYYRIYYQISLANEFIRYSSEDYLVGTDFSEADKGAIRQMNAEARYLRALSYYHALDFFGNVPFADETVRPGSEPPVQIMRPDLYEWVLGELNDIEPLLADARTAEYGRADKGALWALRAKLNLNAEVYTGTAKWAEAMADCQRIIDAGYSLEPTYGFNFNADNHLSPEMIFVATFDGNRTRTYGGTTFLVHSHMGGSMVQADFGTTSGWQGNRGTFNWANKFTIPGDVRANYLYMDGQEDTIMDVGAFTQGIGITKWRNLNRDSTAGVEPGTFVDIDFPMFRLADFYLMYAEAAVHSGSNVATGVGYFNQVRERAVGNSSQNVSSLTLDEILDERGRELYTEGHRRQDLIRFGKFTTGSYLWQFKGGEQFGTALDSKYNLYPLPGADLNANKNLVQNPGY